MDLPPPLRWLESFRQSSERALGQEIIVDVEPTINPLVHRVSIRWSEPLNGNLVMHTWNLLQEWAAKNDCAFDGHTEKDKGFTYLRVKVVTKRRLGPPKDIAP